MGRTAGGLKPGFDRGAGSHATRQGVRSPREVLSGGSAEGPKSASAPGWRGGETRPYPQRYGKSKPTPPAGMPGGLKPGGSVRRNLAPDFTRAASTGKSGAFGNARTPGGRILGRTPPKARQTTPARPADSGALVRSIHPHHTSRARDPAVPHRASAQWPGGRSRIPRKRAGNRGRRLLRAEPPTREQDAEIGRADHAIAVEIADRRGHRAPR